MVGISLREALRAEERAFATLASVRDGRYCSAVVEQVERHAARARNVRLTVQAAVARQQAEQRRAAVTGRKVLVTPSNLSGFPDSDRSARSGPCGQDACADRCVYGDRQPCPVAASLD